MSQVTIKTKAPVSHDSQGNIIRENSYFDYPGFEEENKGEPITNKFARTLVENFWNTKNSKPTDNVAICFDAQPLLLLLSQKGCSGIRFYFAKNIDSGETVGTETLVLVGVDSNGHDMGVIDSRQGMKGSIIMNNPVRGKGSLVIEVGGGNKLQMFKSPVISNHLAHA